MPISYRTDKPINWQEQGQRFDGVADLYDAYRPAYPEELIETVIATTGIQPGGKILEIGGGTGKATALLARRGFSILCIEPGKNLAAVAARKLKDFPYVAFETVTFEDWPECPSEFDLVMSAQAFHWVPKEIGYAKAASVLKENGYLALFWNMYPDPKGEIYSDLNQVYQECAPELTGPSICWESLSKQREQEIVESGYFGPLQVRKFPWSARYDTGQYLGLLNTYSDHLGLPQGKKASLFEGVAEVINKHGGYIEKPYVAVLYIAQKV
jgi:SAM-dependent methyltransferase